MNGKTKLYLAYGSNLNVKQMMTRCPTAKPIGKHMLKNWRLVFRGVADVVQEHGAICPAGIWTITEADERALDVYEGVRGGLYRKVYLPIRPFEGHNEMLLYVMNSNGIFPPDEHYLKGIRDGYEHFHHDEAANDLLDKAVQQSWDDKRPSRRERERAWRKGYPKLARPLDDCKNCGFCPKQPKGQTKLFI